MTHNDPHQPEPTLHTIDLIRKKRDGHTLDDREISFLVTGAANGSIPLEQLSAWLMAAWLRGLSLDETRALTIAMRDSGEKFDSSRLGKVTVDKHSTGGVGDKTSFLVAPLAAACGLAAPSVTPAEPSISWRLSPAIAPPSPCLNSKQSLLVAAHPSLARPLL